MSGKQPKGVNNTFRRTWDKEEFADKAKEREEKVTPCCRRLPLPFTLAAVRLPPMPGLNRWQALRRPCNIPAAV